MRKVLKCGCVVVARLATKGSDKGLPTPVGFKLCKRHIETDRLMVLFRKAFPR